MATETLREAFSAFISLREKVSQVKKLHPLFSTRMRNLSRFTAVEATASGNSANPEGKT
jgi:hypothetical protein